jgi:hypothetical protein
MVCRGRRKHYQFSIQKLAMFVVRSFHVVGVGQFGLHVAQIGPHLLMRDGERLRICWRGQLLKQCDPHDREVMIKGESSGDSIPLTHHKT